MRTHFVWDPLEGNLIRELDDAGGALVEYTTEPNQFGHLLAETRAGDARFHHFDGVANTLALTDENANTTDTFAYSAFGLVTERSGSTPTSLQFQGEIEFFRDAELMSFSYNGNVYAPAIGRWLNMAHPSASVNVFGNRLNAILPNVPLTGDTSNILPWDYQPFGGGKPKPDQTTFCKVQLVCLRLALWGMGPKHCGIEVQDNSVSALGITRYHVDSTKGKCDVLNARQQTWGSSEYFYYRVATWMDITGDLCRCIHKTAKAITAAKLNYALIPGNNVSSDCKTTVSTCNSNYSTHCIMKTCGIDYNDFLFNPYGWDHRMQTCMACCKTQPSGQTYVPDVYCTKWKNIDSAWCADAPNPPQLTPQPEPQQMF